MGARLVYLTLILATAACQRPAVVPETLDITQGFAKTIPGNALQEYPVGNLTDGNVRTAWCQRLGPELQQLDTINNTVSFHFAPIGLAEPLDFFVYSGAGSPEKYGLYDRPQRIEAHLYRASADLPDGQWTLEPTQIFTFNLDDTPAPQRLRLHPQREMRFSTLRFVLHNELAYPGKTHRHMCIAELTIYNPLPPERAR